MVKIEKDDNGFMRQSEEGRATFDRLSYAGWKFIGHGEIIDPDDSAEEAPEDNAFITEYKFVMNGEEIEPHLPASFIAELEAHMERGAQKYARDNWKLAEDPARAFNAAIRHLVAEVKLEDEQKTEDHALAVVANALMLWYMKRKRKMA